jgi:CheY-like chemotaxis protein
MPEDSLAMPGRKANILVVEDDILVCKSLSGILIESGYKVRSAEDGFSALSEIRDWLPDILLSDLNMPGMSGFELLSVIRRRFPAIQVIAMSGMYSGDGVPPGVAADAFYEKGSNPVFLLQIIEVMSHPERKSPLQHSSALAPIWIPKNGHDLSGEPYVIITCSECLRTFPQVLGKAVSPIQETGCVYCSSLIHYAIVQPTDSTFPLAFQRKPGAGMPIPFSVPDLDQ